MDTKTLALSLRRIAAAHTSNSALLRMAAARLEELQTENNRLHRTMVRAGIILQSEERGSNHGKM